MCAKKDATSALVTAMAEFHLKLHPGPPGSPESPGPHVLELLKVRTDIAQRLIKPEMENVWKTLQRKKPKPYALEQWQALNRLLKIPDEDATPQDKASAIFFRAALSVLSTNYPIWTQAEIDGSIADLRCGAKLADLRSAAKLCRRNMKRKDRASGDYAEYARALQDLEERINRHVASFAPSHIIDRKGDNDILCVQIRALAVGMDKLFGRFLCPTVAAVATVALEQTIHEQQVVRWCCRRKPVLRHCP